MIKLYSKNCELIVVCVQFSAFHETLYDGLIQDYITWFL